MNHTVVFDRVGNGYTVRFPYDALLVELLKSRVPSYARTWDKTGKQWTVDADWYQRLAAAMRAVGCTVVGLDAPGSRPTTVRTGLEPYSRLSGRRASPRCTAHCRRFCIRTRLLAAQSYNAN